MNTNTAIAATATAVERLNKSLAKSSLDELVKARTRRSLLLVDCSSSMGQGLRTGGTRIEVLRKVVSDLRATHPVPLASFSGRGVQLEDEVPSPRGGTPMHSAIDFGTEQGANHLVVVTDGEPASESAAFESAARFGGQIDVFYIGDGEDAWGGARFAKELAARTGGTYARADLGTVGAPKVLTGKILLALGDGSESI